MTLYARLDFQEEKKTKFLLAVLIFLFYPRLYVETKHFMLAVNLVGHKKTKAAVRSIFLDRPLTYDHRRAHDLKKWGHAFVWK